MRRVATLVLLLPTLIAIFACGAARLSEITITERPATMGAIADLQRNAPAADCAYDLRESTPATAIFRCANDLTIRFANIDGQLAYACTDATEARCQEAAAPLLGAPETSPTEPSPEPVAAIAPTPTPVAPTQVTPAPSPAQTGRTR